MIDYSVITHRVLLHEKYGNMLYIPYFDDLKNEGKYYFLELHINVQVVLPQRINGAR